MEESTTDILGQSLKRLNRFAIFGVCHFARENEKELLQQRKETSEDMEWRQNWVQVNHLSTKLNFVSNNHKRGGGAPLAHCCAIFLCYLGCDRHQYPMSNNKDHLVGQLTRAGGINAD